jgi:hypothetical protein
MACHVTISATWFAGGHSEPLSTFFSREQNLFSTPHKAQFGVLGGCLRDQDKVALPEPALTVAMTELQYLSVRKPSPIPLIESDNVSRLPSAAFAVAR